ncbi:hypothetical protein SASPL_116018 [Salvia splendens]|uniref:Uncharacterized protein n=1 Tax=Salvia splendens TaxID=180675 RepID=A0A8X9A1U0_SALSN|nr:hypothetical protein SASPL_116018 [Salvia splendens]
MAEDEPRPMQWVVNTNKALENLPNASAESAHWGRGHLSEMEHKHRALLHFLKRSSRPLQIYVDTLTPVTQDLMDAYDRLGADWRDDTAKFLELMQARLALHCDLSKAAHADARESAAVVVLEKLVAVQNDIFIKDIIRSATELNEAGICIKRSKSRSLKDITFHGGVLRLPLIVVDDELESLHLNLIAFERFHVGAGNDLTSYIFFMDNIIDSSLDVSLLHSCGIIQNALGSDKAVAKLFNSLSKDITLDPESYLEQVHKQFK